MKKEGAASWKNSLNVVFYFSLPLFCFCGENMWNMKICENMSPLGWPSSLALSSEEWSMLRQTVSDPLDTWQIIIFQNVLLLNFPRSKFATDSDPEYPLDTSVSESRNNSIPVYCYTWHVWHIIIFQIVFLLNFPRSKFATDSDPEYPLDTSVSESRNDSIPVYCYTWHGWHIIIFQIVFLLNFPSLPPLLASIQLRRSQHFNEEILQILKCWFV